jgi:uncharacterized protein (UPF0332 family)
MKGIEAAKLFAEEIAAKYKEYVKAVWLVTEEDSHTAIVLLDDTIVQDIMALDVVKNELPSVAKRIEKEKGIVIELVFYTLTDYWALIRHGSPVTFSEIREGIPIYDPSGFFTPIKKLLEQGRIPGTKEAMKNLLEEAPIRLLRVERMHLTRIADELMAAVVDSGQAPLLLIGVSPPVPRELADKLRAHFVDKGLLEPEYPKYCEEIVNFAKAIEHKEIEHVKGEDIDGIMDNAARFVERMEKLMRELLKAQKKE